MVVVVGFYELLGVKFSLEQLAHNKHYKRVICYSMVSVILLQSIYFLSAPRTIFQKCKVGHSPDLGILWLPVNFSVQSEHLSWTYDVFHDLVSVCLCSFNWFHSNILNFSHVELCVLLRKPAVLCLNSVAFASAAFSVWMSPFLYNDSWLLFSPSVMSESLWHPVLQHARLPCPSLSPTLAQTHVHWVRDGIQPSHPLSPPSPPAFRLAQHQGLSQWVSSSHQVAKVLELQFQHQSFQ